jgi:hypothetical protein
VDGFVAEASAGDRHAALFAMLDDYSEAEAASLLAKALSDTADAR